MATQYLSPNMALVIPVPGSEPGPDWANDLNASLITIDGHTHVSGSGVAITPAAININADLTFNSFNATSLKSTRFTAQGSAIPSSSPNVGCVYVAGNELYYNDVSGGHQVQITASGSVNAGAGSIGGLPSGTAAVNYSNLQATYAFQSATSVAGNIDAGSLIVRYPGAYPTPSGSYIAIQAPSSLASAYALTLPGLPAQTNVLTLGTTGTIGSTTWNAVGQNMTSVGANAIGVSMTATGSNAVANSRTRATNAATVAAGGVAISGNSGTFVAPTSAATNVTNLSVTLTTTGRPVLLCLQPFTSGSNLSSNVSANGIGVIFFKNVTTSVVVGSFVPVTTSTTQAYPSGIVHVDTTVSGLPATYNYVVQTVATGTTIQNCVLVALEL